MADPIKTNIDIGSVISGPCHFADDVVTLAAATTYKAGLILARDSATLKLIPFVKAGVTNGNGIPKAVLQEVLVTVGAGDYRIRPVLTGRVNFARLVIQADGTNANIDAAVLDQLRAYGIASESTTQLAKADN